MASPDPWSLACLNTVGEGIGGPAVDIAVGCLLGGRYTIRRELGAGGQGTVYVAWDAVGRREVAIKAPRVGRRPDRILREARSLAAAEHSNIVRFLELVPDGARPLLVMELLGPTLSERVRSLPEGRVPLHELAEAGTQVLYALEACHRAGLVHRDVKPSNIARASLADSTVKLVDLGLATKTGRLSKRTAVEFEGTPRYASVWALEGNRQRPLDDLWGLLYTLVHCASGGLPWSRSATREEVLRGKREYLDGRLCESLPMPFEGMRAALREADALGATERDAPYTACFDALRDLKRGEGIGAGPEAWDPRVWEAGAIRRRMEGAAAWRAPVTGAPNRYAELDDSSEGASVL